jgi:hypothetical protein
MDTLPQSPAIRPGLQVQSTDPSLPARTTFQEDLTTASQRKVNLIWESTQAVIALLVTIATMIAGLYSMVNGVVQIPTILAVAFGTVIGFYFSRTNHAAIGGIGLKPESPYLGR